MSVSQSGVWKSGQRGEGTMHFVGGLSTTLDLLFTLLVLSVSTAVPRQSISSTTCYCNTCPPCCNFLVVLVFRFNITAEPTAHYVLFCRLTVLFTRYIFHPPTYRTIRASYTYTSNLIFTVCSVEFSFWQSY